MGYNSVEDKQKLPTFYLGQFKVLDVEEYLLDTFLSLDGCKKELHFSIKQIYGVIGL
jgi:hypothetical protein